MAKKKSDKTKGVKKKKKPSKKWTLYEVGSEGKVKKKNKFCPKCGSGIFLAEHIDRRSCGKCGYTEFLKKV